jgi:hypothetical protein
MNLNRQYTKLIQTPKMNLDFQYAKIFETPKTNLDRRSATNDFFLLFSISDRQFSSKFHSDFVEIL